MKDRAGTTGVSRTPTAGDWRHVWVREKGLSGEDGGPLAGSQVGFAPENEAVLDSLSPEFAGHLRELGLWFEYLRRFRHALEHHVPLYVPGNTVSEETLRGSTGSQDVRGR